MRTRGLTLFEVLLALALLVAMAALTLPSVMNSLHEQSFVASSDLLKDQFLRARAYAQAEGEAVEIRYHTSLNLVETRLFIPGRNAEEREDVIAGEMFAFENEENSDLVIAEGWALQDLPTGIELSRTAPQAASLSQEELEFAAAGEFDPAEVARDETQPVLRLAVFLPDGSALLSHRARAYVEKAYVQAILAPFFSPSKSNISLGTSLLWAPIANFGYLAAS